MRGINRQYDYLVIDRSLSNVSYLYTSSKMRLIALCLLIFILLQVRNSYAEAPGPSVHWGAIAYPDQISTAELGGTFNRFTQQGTDSDGRLQRSFGGISNTMGFNQATVSWTKHLEIWDGISSNITLALGPTGNQPTEWIQNKAIHGTFGYPPVRFSSLRDETDFALDASLTKWFSLVNPRTTFVGLGLSGGSLYQEIFMRFGARRLPLADSGWANHLRLSAMVRYSRIYDGAAFHQLSDHSFLTQASLAWGIYNEDNRPHFEIEIGVTNDSGIFRNSVGTPIQQSFGTFAIRGAGLTFEMWNDSWYPGHFGTPDIGPTGGGKLMFDVCHYSRAPVLSLSGITFLSRMCS